MGINFAPIKRIYTGFPAATLTTLYAAISPTRLQSTFGSFLDLHPRRYCRDFYFRHLVGVRFRRGSQANEVVRRGLLSVPALAAALNFAIIAVDVGYRFAWLFGSFPVTTMVIGMPFCSTFLKLNGAEAVLNSIRSGDRDGFKDVHKPRVLIYKPDLLHPFSYVLFSSIFCTF